MPLVSVIIPMYNHAKYIEACLCSIENDDYPETEVLIIDDGSTDGSFEAGQKWRENHPHAFRSFELYRQNNQGITATLNRLTSLARGELIALLASDDYVLPGGIRLRVEALSSHPEWLAVFGDCIVVDEEGQLVWESGLHDLYGANKFALSSPQFITRELILRWSVPGPVFMARREAYDEGVGIGKYNEDFVLEDRDCYLRLLSRSALGFIDYPVAAYRVGNGNTIRRIEYREKVRESLWRSDYENAMLFEGSYRLMLRVTSKRWRNVSWREKSTGIGEGIRVVLAWGNELLWRCFLFWHKVEVKCCRIFGSDWKRG